MFSFFEVSLITTAASCLCAGLVYWLSHRRVHQLTLDKHSLQQRLEHEHQRWQEKEKTLTQAQQQFSDAFKAMSSEALAHNNKSFLTLAQQSFQRLQDGAKGDLSARQQEIKSLMNPMKQALDTVNTRLQDLEKARVGAYEVLKHQVNDLVASQKELRSETANLVKALRAPGVRGRWGEMQLKRVVELTGLSQHCDFVEQASFEGDENRLRPDMIVRLPGNKTIVIDAKVPLAAYLEAIEATDDASRLQHFKDHARQVRAHITALSSRAYWDQISKTDSPEFVVLFLPGDTFFSAALEHDPGLIEMGVEKKVILTTPSTLIALLHAVAYGWRQESLAENAREISELGKDLYKRLSDMGGHVSKLGRDLGTAVKSFNSTVGSLERRVLPAARRFKDLESTSAR
ncbi:MAG: DNA recombination protein RmuC, partial [Alphaproteobacteria bacterium]